ncbi:MAG: hypothetical protein K6E50_14045 [Lachnospiraceae bacterium]|nr:hypothetical protein [Lachnospiraceae bacterium]
MKTEIIYSRNRKEDIDRALEEIAAFRRQYASVLTVTDGRRGEALCGGLMICGAVTGLVLDSLITLPLLHLGIFFLGHSFAAKKSIASWIRENMIRKRCAGLIESDATLEGLVKDLEELGAYVEISNVMQECYERYQGKMDVRVDERRDDNGESCHVLSIITDGYSDDIGKSGRVKIPGMTRSFPISPEAFQKIFRRGVIDFSWLDGQLSTCAQRMRALREEIGAFGAGAQKALPMKETPDAVEFRDIGDNPRDILD